MTEYSRQIYGPRGFAYLGGGDDDDDDNDDDDDGGGGGNSETTPSFPPRKRCFW